MHVYISQVIYLHSCVWDKRKSRLMILQPLALSCRMSLEQFSNGVTKMSTQVTRSLLTRKQAATRLGVSLRHVDNLAKAKAFPVVRMGASVRIADEDLEAYVTACKVPSVNDIKPMCEVK